MQYTKPWISFTEQLDQLIARGLEVTDKPRALDYLERIGYYRLSGYWYPFRERSGALCLLDNKGRSGKVCCLVLDEFQAGAHFQHALDLYVFDKQLRLLALDALERIEIALRVDISHLLGKKDPFAYLNPNLFHATFSTKLDPKNGLTAHHSWLSKHAQLINRSKEDFVRHNKQKYGLPLAIWVACELWDFGSLSTLFNGMQEKDQDEIATRYGLNNGRIFATWLRCLNYLRNICAHHSRLWNRNIVDQPKLPSSQELPWIAFFEGNEHARARCFLLLKITQQVLDVVNPRSSWSVRMQAHLQSFPVMPDLNINHRSMGAPDKWQQVWEMRAIKNPSAVSPA